MQARRGGKCGAQEYARFSACYVFVSANNVLCE